MPGSDASVHARSVTSSEPRSPASCSASAHAARPTSREPGNASPKRRSSSARLATTTTLCSPLAFLGGCTRSPATSSSLAGARGKPRASAAAANKQFEGQSLGALASLAIEDGRPEDATRDDEGCPTHRPRSSARPSKRRSTSFACPRTRVRGRSSRRCRETSLVRSGDPGARPVPARCHTLRGSSSDTLTRIRTQLDGATFDAARGRQGKALTADEAVELALTS